METKVFDLEQAMQRVDGDRELYAELVEIFFHEKPQALAKLKSAVGAQNAKATEEAAHSIKSALGNLGAMTSYSLAQTLEIAAKGNDLSAAAQTLDALQEEVSKYEQAVADFRKA